MRYPAHRTLIRPAAASAALWRLLAGIVLIVVLFLALSALYGYLCSALLPASAWGIDGMGLETATTPVGALVNLGVFGLLIMALAAALPLIHKRRLSSLIGPTGRAIRQASRVLGAVLGLYVVLSLLPMPDGFTPVENLDTGRWLAFLPLTLLGLVVQVSAEELIFRGYIQSQLAVRFARPAVWIIVPSAVFGALHYQPSVMGDAAWVIVVWATFFGVAAADLTARSGTLGPAIALHLVNNFSAIALIAPQGSFDGLALYAYPFGPENTGQMMQWMPVELMVLLCSWLVARLALRV